MLLGRDDEIVEAVPARNLAAEANRYLVDPQDHISVRRRIRGTGVDLVGFYHSHPHAAARPSATDVAEASYPDHLYLIVAIQGRDPEVRLYRLTGGNFAESPFVTVT
jgi:proteasome lid subunit RPN8/RPN11